MDNTNVQTHLKEMQQFLKLSDNINMLLHNFDNIDKVDGNDLYDLIYNKKKIENWLKEDIENEDIKNDLQKILNAINTITNTLSENQITDIMDNDTKDIHKLNKLKYGNKNEYKGLKDKKELRQKQQNLIQSYVVRYLPRLLILTIIMFGIQSGWLHKVVDKMSTFAVETIESTIETNEQTQNTEVPKDMESLIRITSKFISLAATIIIICTLLRLILDILYIAMPITRIMFKDSIVSEEAKEFVTLASYDTELEPSEVDYRDRIKTATAILNNIDIYVEALTNEECNKEFKRSKSEMLTIIKSLKSRTKNNKQLEMINALVDAELMYINLNLKEKIV